MAEEPDITAKRIAQKFGRTLSLAEREALEKEIWISMNDWANFVTGVALESGPR